MFQINLSDLRVDSYALMTHSFFLILLDTSQDRGIRNKE